MKRLQSELRRLYLPPSSPADSDPFTSALIDPLGQVRAMVFEVSEPPSWGLLAKVWQGVQAELDLPAPAIAVSGTDGLQLWFSLVEPTPVARAHDFLTALRERFLGDVAANRIRLMPAPDASAAALHGHAPLVPAPQGSSGNWSAFIAQDLAPVFAETPWLDTPPNEEGQASLLGGLASIKPASFEAALDVLAPRRRESTPGLTKRPELSADLGSRGGGSASSAPINDHDPRHFLRRVMNDDSVPLALRIDAARALLHDPADPR